MKKGDLLLIKKKITFHKYGANSRVFLPNKSFFALEDINKKLYNLEDWAVLMPIVGYVTSSQLSKYFYTGKHLLTEKKIIIMRKE